MPWEIRRCMVWPRVMAARKAFVATDGSRGTICGPLRNVRCGQQWNTFRTPIWWRQHNVGAGIESCDEAARQLQTRERSMRWDESKTDANYVCMPFYDSSNRTQCLSETMEAIAMLEEIIADHPLHSFVVGGDFNTEFRDNSPFDVLWRECLLKNDLVCCDHLFNNNSNNNNNMHTYVHQTLDHSKWNDHFLISSCLTRASSHHVIMEDGANVSDHLPIMMSLTCNLSQAPTTCWENVKPPTLKWETGSLMPNLKSLRTHLRFSLISLIFLSCYKTLA